jgi:hypothetical protein
MHMVSRYCSHYLSFLKLGMQLLPMITLETEFP